MGVAGDACRLPILSDFQAAGCVADVWVDRKDGGLTSLWVAGRFVYPFAYQGRKYLKLKEYLLITNQSLYQLS